MISRLGLAISRVVSRFLPDPFVIAVLLTLLTAALALAFGTFPTKSPAPDSLPARTAALLDAWRSGDGLWKFLAFSMQMCLILVTGHALAQSRPVRRALERLASFPRTTAQGATLIAACGCGASLLNWGLGLIAGAILAREVGRSLHNRGIRAHYPLLVAAGFTGFMVWHGGLSGSAPLSMTTLESAAKVLPPHTIEVLRTSGYASGIPLNKTIGSPLNIAVTAGLLVIVPVCCALLAPRHAADVRPIGEVAPAMLLSTGTRGTGVPPAPTPTTPSSALSSVVSPPPTPAPLSLADRLDASRLISLLLVAPLLLAVWRFADLDGLARVGLNEITMTMLALGLILHGSPRSYLAAIDEGARGCGGIILQFPLYGGIMAMLVASGLDRQIATGLVGLADARTLPLLTFLAACILNMFIPSGGGQWGVQGPIALDAGMRLGVDPGEMVMAVAYGDQVTNMLQVFWALPLLAVTGARARDIVGYTSIVMIFGGVWVALALLAI